MTATPTSESIWVRQLIRLASLDRRLVGCDLRVISLIQSHVKNGWAWRSQRKMAADLGVDRVTVLRAVARLEALGYVEIEHRRGPSGGNASAAYRLAMSEVQGDMLADPPGGADATAPVAPATPPPVASGDSAPVASDATTGTDSLEQGRKRERGARARRKRLGPDEGQRELLPVVPVDGEGEGFAAGGRRSSLGSRSGASSRIPADWQPSAFDREWARRKGLSDADIDEQAERMRDHWLRKPGRDGLAASWNAAWRSWVRGYLDRQEAGSAERAERGGDHGKGNDRGGRAAAGLARTEGERLSDAFAALRRRR